MSGLDTMTGYFMGQMGSAPPAALGIDIKTAEANLAFIRDAMTDALKDDPTQRDAVRFRLAESLEALKTLDTFIHQANHDSPT